eukprot:scaffold5889_cov115-Cylindrotheca_fusiformis.AAC.6
MKLATLSKPLRRVGFNEGGVVWRRNCLYAIKSIASVRTFLYWPNIRVLCSIIQRVVPCELLLVAAKKFRMVVVQATTTGEACPESIVAIVRTVTAEYKILVCCRIYPVNM